MFCLILETEQGDVTFYLRQEVIYRLMQITTIMQLNELIQMNHNCYDLRSIITGNVTKFVSNVEMAELRNFAW